MRNCNLLSIVVLAIVMISASCNRGGEKQQYGEGIHIDPMADIHPSVIMIGKVSVGPFTRIGPGVILTGNIEIGHHTLIQTNTALRGTIKVGNYVHIYDNVNIEGGRPANVGTVTNTVPDQSIIGDYCWINHGSVMHGTQMREGSAMGLGCACDYNTILEEGAILGTGSATTVNQVIPANSFAEGVPAVVKETDIDDEFRRNYFGLLPRGWVEYEAPKREEQIRRMKEKS